MALHVTQDLVSFTTVEGDRTTIKLEDLFPEDPTRTSAEERAALLAWGAFFQLAEISQAVRQINARIGTLDQEAGTGTGLMGLLGQQAVSMLEISTHLGTLNDHLETMQKKAAEVGSLDPAALVGQAKKIFEETLGGMMPGAGSPHPNATRTPKAPAAADGS